MRTVSRARNNEDDPVNRLRCSAQRKEKLMKTAEEMRQAAAEEIAQDMVRLLDAVLKDKGFPSSCTTYSRTAI